MYWCHGLDHPLRADPSRDWFDSGVVHPNYPRLYRGSEPPTVTDLQESTVGGAIIQNSDGQRNLRSGISIQFFNT